MVLKGLTLANSDWTEKYPDSRFHLVVKDAQADGDSAVKSFDEMVTKDGVLAVVGPLGAQGAAKAVAPQADRYGVPVLTLTQKEDERATSSFVVHVFLDNREMVRSPFNTAAANLGIPPLPRFIRTTVTGRSSRRFSPKSLRNSVAR